MEVMPPARAARASSSTRSKSADPCSQSMKATSNPSAPECSTSAGDGKFALSTSTVPPDRSFSFARFMRLAAFHFAELGQHCRELLVFLLEELRCTGAVLILVFPLVHLERLLPLRRLHHRAEGLVP